MYVLLEFDGWFVVSRCPIFLIFLFYSITSHVCLSFLLFRICCVFCLIELCCPQSPASLDLFEFIKTSYYTLVPRLLSSPINFTTNSSSQGTSRPAHYYVLYDDNNFIADHLHKLTYQLCHTLCSVHAQCVHTRPSILCAPGCIPCEVSRDRWVST